MVVLVYLRDEKEFSYYEEYRNRNYAQKTFLDLKLLDYQMTSESKEQHFYNSVHIVTAKHLEKLDTYNDIQAFFKEKVEMLRACEVVGVGHHIYYESRRLSKYQHYYDKSRDQLKIEGNLVEQPLNVFSAIEVFFVSFHK